MLEYHEITMNLNKAILTIEAIQQKQKEDRNKLFGNKIDIPQLYVNFWKASCYLSYKVGFRLKLSQIEFSNETNEILKHECVFVAS